MTWDRTYREFRLREDGRISFSGIDIGPTYLVAEIGHYQIWKTEAHTYWSGIGRRSYASAKMRLVHVQKGKAQIGQETQTGHGLISSTAAIKQMWDRASFLSESGITKPLEYAATYLARMAEKQAQQSSKKKKQTSQNQYLKMMEDLEVQVDWGTKWYVTNRHPATVLGINLRATFAVRPTDDGIIAALFICPDSETRRFGVMIAEREFKSMSLVRTWVQSTLAHQ